MTEVVCAGVKKRADESSTVGRYRQKRARSGQNDGASDFASGEPRWGGEPRYLVTLHHCTLLVVPSETMLGIR